MEPILDAGSIGGGLARCVPVLAPYLFIIFGFNLTKRYSCFIRATLVTIQAELQNLSSCIRLRRKKQQELTSTSLLGRMPASQCWRPPGPRSWLWEMWYLVNACSISIPTGWKGKATLWGPSYRGASWLQGSPPQGPTL